MAEKRKQRSATQEKRRLILSAAVRVFAKKGFHRCRISDIAAEAEVAYGLVYHYFENKEDILNSIFDENWGMLAKVIENVEEQSNELDAKLQAIVDFILDAYRLVPDILQVMVMEIARSSKFLKKPKIEAFEQVFQQLTRILAEHQERGEVRRDLDPKLMAYMIFGSIELILTGYLLGTIEPCMGEVYESNRRVFTQIFLHGIRGS
ncbi:MAG: TetR/AcrR family transcriptional regulator [Deltaproteobacteria bacterium]|nr:TetR/AcrR family transcriptional regulator [Deltaproteobacteria bacterium]